MALTLHLAIHPVTLWLFWGFLGFLVGGPVLGFLTSPWLEIGALALWNICWIVALILLLLMIGSLL